MQHDPEKKTTIKTNISDYTIGMRMTQPGDNGKPKLIIYHLRKLVQAELHNNQRINQKTDKIDRSSITVQLPYYTLQENRKWTHRHIKSQTRLQIRRKDY